MDGSRGKQPLTHLTDEEVRKYLGEASSSPMEEKCRGEVCDL